MFYSFCLSKMGKRYATRQKTRESAVMSGETENREDILPHSLAFGSHVSRDAPFAAATFLEWVALSLFLLRKPKPGTLPPPFRFRH